jgi:PAS domain S-box-containing protein
MNHLFQALASAADGAFVVNKEQHIIYWNQAAQDILGHAFAEIFDQPCYDILAGCNDEGRLICHDHCRVGVKALSGELITNYDTRVRTKEDGLRWINMSTFTFPANGDGIGPVLVHLFRDVTQKKQQEQFVDQVLGAAKTFQIESFPSIFSPVPEETHVSGLTDRESEVLALLAEGLNTSDIASSLSISPSTVRNHVRNILQKFHVHNRLEAVIYALKHGLITKE